MTILKHTINGTPSSNWYYRFSVNGRVYFGSTKSSNKAQAHKYELMMRQKAIKEAHYGEKKIITLEDALTGFEEALPETSSSVNVSTYIRKLLGAKCCSDTKHGKDIKVFGFDGEQELQTLKDSDVQTLITARKREGNSSATIKHELTQLKKTIEYWNKMGFAAPVIDFKGLKKDNKLKPAKGKLRWLAVNEELALLAELNPLFGKNELEVAQKQDAYDLVTVLLDTGARYQEIAALKWKDVDLENKHINLYRPKVNNESVIYMTDRVFNVLTRRYAEGVSNVYVFTNKSGEECRNYAPRSFKSACRRAGIEKATLHTLRKTFASRLVQNGVPITEVSNLVGHSSVVTTMKHYAFLAPNTGAMNAAAVLNKINNGGANK